MTERKWKLNEDMHQEDCILDPVTFQQVIDAVHCNERVINGLRCIELHEKLLKVACKTLCT